MLEELSPLVMDVLGALVFRRHEANSPADFFADGSFAYVRCSSGRTPSGGVASTRICQAPQMESETALSQHLELALPKQPFVAPGS